MNVNYLEILIILTQFSAIISARNRPKRDLACRDDHPEYLLYPGDVLLGGLFPIHQRPVISKGILQEPKLTATGYKMLEAMLYAIDDINSRQNYLNFTLGALVFDTCANPDSALFQSLHFIVFNSLLDNSSKVDNYTTHTVPRRPMETYVLAIIGGLQSDVSISVANVLKFMYIPQISYMSSSSQLDDADKYKYFLRTVPSMSETIHVIIELLRKYNWFYVNVVLDNSEHGESNYGVFMEKLSQYSGTICVAKDVRLIAYPLDAKDISKRLKSLLDSPATVNILLVTPATASLTIHELLKWNQSSRDRFLWIGTNGLISTYSELHVDDDGDDLNPAYIHHFTGFKKFILVMPHLTEREKLKDYSMNLQRTFNLTSWTNSYLLQFCGCLPNDVDLYNSSGKVCTIGEEEECLSFLHKDSIYYVPQVVNSVYAVANALRQIFIQFPTLKWHDKSSEQMRKLLLTQLHQCQFKGFGDELFSFFDKRNGQPKFTVLTFIPYALKWEVLAQYDALRSPNFHYINENISTFIHKSIPESVCSKPCHAGQIKRVDWGRSCCWTCVNCSAQQIVTSSVFNQTNNPHNLRGIQQSMSTMCQFCNPGYRPNKNQTKCQMLPIRYMSINEKAAQTSVGISSIGLILCLVVSVICIKNWQTPIVKASGKETSVILFLGIILSYISGELILALPPSTFICNFAIFSVGVCITLTYSAILARSSRINSIFQINELQMLKAQKISGPKSQLIIIGVCCVTQIIVLSIICGITPTSPSLVLSDYETNSPYSAMDTRSSMIIVKDGNSTRIIKTDKQLILHGLSHNLMLCFPDFTIKQIITIFIPLILMCLSTVYAYKIRKVPSGFNEARALAFVNYINCICFITTPVLMYYAQKTTLELVPLSFLLMATATNEFSVLILPKIYIILFRPYKNTRASIMQRLRGLSEVECMEWINEVASRSPPGVFSISGSKVLNPWLKIRELSSKSLCASTNDRSNCAKNKSEVKTADNKMVGLDHKCLVTEFSYGTSIATGHSNFNSSTESVDKDEQITFRMRPKVVSFVERYNSENRDKKSASFHQATNQIMASKTKNDQCDNNDSKHIDDNQRWMNRNNTS
uniref:G-protein coupled receptors family 3 profile domain-containing protein n=2 Tax=Trichobilharzia regenti TaxID=157069 RepID=A0AA85JPM9_TRIRE|nr:unnamed protein product [Trichobilharzia regenti]